MPRIWLSAVDGLHHVATDGERRSFDGAPCAKCMNAAIDMTLAEAALVATVGAR